MRLVFLGPPGAGKGTLAVRLAEHFSLAHIATGDLLRRNVQEGTELGKKAQSFLERGALVPDDLVIAMVKERFRKPDAKKGFILDGFPRTVAQAEALDQVLSQMNSLLGCVAYFETSIGTIIDRLSGRWTCTQCGMSFHVRNIPPKRKGICDRCGSKLVQREDDKEETVHRRLEVYEQETAPLIKYYEKRNLLKKTSGDRPLEEQFEFLKNLCLESVA
ncbi:MAG: adenylate kinase [Candidatus Omnitrophica bacterium]|nr:adenylate kinase [Candidatus Omnitrophota bacterium]